MKKRLPTAATTETNRGVLPTADYYLADQFAEESDTPTGGIDIKPFAWPMIIQAAGLAEQASNKLKLTEAGKEALGHPPQKVLKKVWQKWQATDFFDEFRRMDDVKG